MNGRMCVTKRGKHVMKKTVNLLNEVVETGFAMEGKKNNLL